MKSFGEVTNLDCLVKGSVLRTRETGHSGQACVCVQAPQRGVGI